MPARIDPGAQERGARRRKHADVVRRHIREREVGKIDDLGRRPAMREDGTTVANIAMGEMEEAAEGGVSRSVGQSSSDLQV